MVVLAPGGPPVSRRVYLSQLDMPKGDFRYWPISEAQAASQRVRFLRYCGHSPTHAAEAKMNRKSRAQNLVPMFKNLNAFDPAHEARLASLRQFGNPLMRAED